jgi:hypothetical protein
MNVTLSPTPTSMGFKYNQRFMLQELAMMMRTGKVQFCKELRKIGDKHAKFRSFTVEGFPQ